MKLKKELEERIKNEITVKKTIKQKIHDHQEESMHIVERINSLSDLNLKHSMSKKDVFKSSRQSSSSKIKKSK